MFDITEVADRHAYYFYQRLPDENKNWSDHEMIDREKAAYKRGIESGYRMGLEPKPSSLLSKLFSIFG